MRRVVSPEVYKLILDNPTGRTSKLFELAVQKGYQGNSTAFYTLKRRTLERNLPKESDNEVRGPRGKSELSIKDFMPLLKSKKQLRMLEVCRIFSCSPDEVIEAIKAERKKGTEIVLSDDDFIFLSDGSVMQEPEKMITPIAGDQDEIVFGLCGDLHFGSRAVQITALNQFCDNCKSEGIKHIFVAGDIVDGYKVYRGQEHECYTSKADEQEDSALKNLPTGFEWYIMMGNHDYSFIKSSGHNPLAALESRRDDIHYIGLDEVVVPLLKGVDMMLWHPGGGNAYAKSYKLQKKVEQIAFDELRKLSFKNTKPTIRFIGSGHFHQQLDMTLGNMVCIQVGSFQGENRLSKTRAWSPVIGGYTVRAWLRKDGNLDNYITRFWLKNEIEEDHKNYRHSYTNGKTQITQPLLTPILKK